MLGFNSAVTIDGVINLQLPLRYPDFQQTAVSLYAATVAVEGIGSPYQNTFSVGYTKARIIVNYRSFPWSFEGIKARTISEQPDRPNQSIQHLRSTAAKLLIGIHHGSGEVC